MATYDRVMQYQRRQVSRGYAATYAAFDCYKPLDVASVVLHNSVAAELLASFTVPALPPS